MPGTCVELDQLMPIKVCNMTVTTGYFESQFIVKQLLFQNLHFEDCPKSVYVPLLCVAYQFKYCSIATGSTIEEIKSAKKCTENMHNGAAPSRSVGIKCILLLKKNYVVVIMTLFCF